MATIQNNLQKLKDPIPVTEQKWDDDIIPLVTVLCITYNHENYISNAIEGFLMQNTTFPVEVMIHDDASTDRTTEIIREYESRYPQLIIAIYQTENQFSKRNGAIGRIVIKKRRGTYIALCEGDDYWTDPLKLQKQVDFLESNPEYVMCYHPFKTLQGGKLSRETFPKRGRDFTPDELIATPSGIATATKLYRNVFNNEKTRNDYFRFKGDYPLNAYLGTFGACKFLKEIGPSVYRLHKGGIWASRMKTEKLLGIINTKILIYRNFMEMGDQRSAIISLRALNDIIQSNLWQIAPTYTTFKINFSGCIIAFMGFVISIQYGTLSRFVKKLFRR